MKPVVPQPEMERFRDRVVGRSISEDTFTAYKLWIERFEEWYDREGKPSLRDLEDFDSFLYDPERVVYPWENRSGRRAPRSYAYSSRNQAISAVKKWVRRHYDVDIPEQPGDIVLGEESEFTPEYLSRERVQDIIEEAPDACASDGCKAALALSYDAVLRASELVLLEVSDVSAETREIAVSATKGSRDSTITVSEETMSAVQDYLERADHSTGALVRNTYGDPWNKTSWAQHVLRHHAPEGSHAFGRHTPILHQLEAGVEFGQVYRRARHKNPSTTARYAREVDVDVPTWAGDG